MPPDLTSPCSDGIKDGQETDVDCGGPVCQACGNGKACGAGTDCSSTACCASVCTDLLSSGTSCGACGKTCPGSGACVGGMCQGCALAMGGQLFPPPLPTGVQAVSLVVGGFVAPQGLVISPTGTIYVSDTAAATIYAVDPVGKTSTKLIGGQSDVTGLSFDANGNLIEALRGGNQLARIPMTNGVAGTPVVIGSPPAGPWGIAEDAQGNLYTAEEFGSRVNRVHPNGTVDLGVITGLTGPLEVKFDPFGNLLVGIYNIHNGTTVNCYSTQNFALLQTFTVPTGPIGIALDRDANLYVASYNASVVTRVASDGSATPFISAGLAGPHAIAFDSKGSLYVINNSNGTLVRTAPASAGLCP